MDQVQPVEIMIEVNKPKSRYSNIDLTAIIERLNRLGMKNSNVCVTQRLFVIFQDRLSIMDLIQD